MSSLESTLFGFTKRPALCRVIRNASCSALMFRLSLIPAFIFYFHQHNRGVLPSMQQLIFILLLFNFSYSTICTKQLCFQTSKSSTVGNKSFPFIVLIVFYTALHSIQYDINGVKGVSVDLWMLLSLVHEYRYWLFSHFCRDDLDNKYALPRCQHLVHFGENKSLNKIMDVHFTDKKAQFLHIFEMSLQAIKQTNLS